MRSVNKVILIGNLTRDPELKSTIGGQSIASFGMATNRQWTTSTGEKRNSAEFHEVVAWAKLAEICQQYIKKGMLVYIEGYLKTRSWDLEDGTRRFKTEVVASDMIILEKRGEGEDYTPTGDDMDIPEDVVIPEEVAETPAEETLVEAAPASAPEAAPKEDDGSLSANIDDDNLF